MNKTIALPIVIACAAVGCGSEDSSGGGIDVPEFGAAPGVNGGTSNPTPTPGVAPGPGGVTPVGTEGQGAPPLAAPGTPGAPPAGGGAAAPGAPTDPAAVPGTGSMLDVTILAEATVTDPAVGGFILEGAAPQRTIGGMEIGSVACFDNVDLAGVQSIDISYARDASIVSASGRFALLLSGAEPLSAGSDPTTAENIGEKVTTTTGAWTTFQNLNVGLSRPVNEVRTLCIRGLQGNGILNIQSLTLRGTPGTNDGVTDFNAPPPDPAAVPQVARPQVVGNQVQFGGPNTSVAGPSLFWSNGGYGNDRFYNADVVNWVAQDWGAGIIRAAMAVDDLRGQPDQPTIEELGGYLTREFDSTLNVKKVVNAAIENGIYVIIDWHAHAAEQNTDAAVRFFGEMASIYGGYNNVIYEIYNEPVAVGWEQIKQYAQPVMQAIRAQDPDNLIIVGTPEYSSNLSQVPASPVDDDNVAYTLHFYAGEDFHDGYRARATDAMNAGIALFVTEWGTTPANGSGQPNAGSTQQWMDFLKTNNISHCNWAIADQGEATASQLVRGASASGDWADEQLTTSGQLVRDIIRGWEAR